MTSVPEPDDTRPALVRADDATTAVIRGVVAVEDLARFFDASFSALPGIIASQGVSISGPAFGLYHAPPRETVALEVGFVTDRPIRQEGDAVPSTRPGGRVARVVHRGAYDALGDSWQRLEAWVRLQGLSPGTPLWEIYVTKPHPEMNPDDLRTELNWPVAGPA